MESGNFCNEKFLEEYNTFLNQLIGLFDQEDDKLIVKNLIKECETDKLARGKRFYDSVEDDTLFDLFCKSRVKLFSSKDDETIQVSNSLFGEDLPLKRLINNQSDNTKNIIWKYLYLFYFLIEANNSNRSERKSKISKLLKDKNKNLSENVKNDLIGVDVNKDTNNMIDDIVNSFETSLSGDNSNPFENIMKITQDITDKYNDKIESGEIELDKLMGSIQKNIPGMPNFSGGKGSQPEEKVIIDDNFSTDDVELGDKDQKSSGMNLNNMLNMMNSMGGGKGGPELGGLFSMLEKLDKVDSNEDAESLKKEMDSYLEDQLGVDVSKLNQQLGEAEDNMKIKYENTDSDLDEPDQD